MINILLHIGVALALLALGYWLSARRLLDQVRQIHAGSLGMLEGERQHAVAQWEAADLRAADWERRAGEFQKINASILHERDKWQALYWSQGAGHGNAQALMMATIDVLARQLMGLGKKVVIPPVIQATMDEYREQHVSTVPPEPGTPQISRPPEEAPQVADITSTERTQVKES